MFVYSGMKSKMKLIHFVAVLGCLSVKTIGQGMLACINSRRDHRKDLSAC